MKECEVHGYDGDDERRGNSQHDALRDPRQMLLKSLAVVAKRHGSDEQRLPGGKIEDAVIGDRPGNLRALSGRVRRRVRP